MCFHTTFERHPQYSADIVVVVIYFGEESRQQRDRIDLMMTKTTFSLNQRETCAGILMQTRTFTKSCSLSLFLLISIYLSW